MKPSIVLDIFESPEMETLLSQTLEVVRKNMVALGLADFYWVSPAGRITLEHKTSEQVLAEMGGRLDLQLIRYLTNADIVGLVIDNIVTPDMDKPYSMVWKQDKADRIFYPFMRVKVAFENYQAYLWSLRNQGIVVAEFPNLKALCRGISSFLHNSLKSTHTTLRRHYKPQIPPLINPDPRVETLMGMSGLRIGEKTAKSLIDAYGSLIDIYNADPSDLEILLGKVGTSRFLDAIGRNKDK